MAKHPIQPIEKDHSGTWRFKRNGIVEWLLENGPFDMNDIACENFSREDREQFAQLIGYSVYGSADLSYMSDDVLESVGKTIENGSDPNATRMEVLICKLHDVAESVKELTTKLFQIHPDDLPNQYPKEK